MDKNQAISEIKSGAKLSVRVILVLIIVIVFTFVYVRTHPKWKAAEIAIEPAHRFFDIQCLDPDGSTLETRILPPEGFTRTDAAEGSFPEYLRKYPMLPDNINLPVFDGTTITSTTYAAIFDISIGDEGYQQCADSVIRLYSDYFYETDQLDKISFQFENGDICDYNRWRKGKRIFALSGFSCELPFALPDNSKQQYMNYLKEVMRYASTKSLQKESVQISPEEMRTGDIICNDTHVVMIVDEAVNEKGERCFLIGQSFIPAVCFHIISKTEGRDVTPWFTEEELSQDSFSVGIFGFGKENIRRWKDGF